MIRRWLKGERMTEVAPGVYVLHARRRVRRGARLRMRGDHMYLGGRFR